MLHYSVRPVLTTRLVSHTRDFDRLAWGHPELDVATFLAEMDFEDRREVDVDAINAAFVSGYERSWGALDADLLRAYRSHKRLSKAWKAARSLRRDGELRALRYIEFARRALTESS